MYNYHLHSELEKQLTKNKIDKKNKDADFYARLLTNFSTIEGLFKEVYGKSEIACTSFNNILETIIQAYYNRSKTLRDKDTEKLKKGSWFLSNQLAGMSLYVDRFCGSLQNLETKLDYFTELGVNVLHLMPLFESPEGESDGGYAVSDFRKIDSRFGNLDDLKKLQQEMHSRDIHLMIDIVLNHTSNQHEWAKKAQQGDTEYQEYYYMYEDRNIPNEFDKTMPEIFPESSPGSFSYDGESKKWVMTVFHHYQWDLNYTNPAVFTSMLDTIFFYANLGVDILRIDAPAFIWKQIGTTCQNLPQAHIILQLIKQCVNVAAPGMALLGEAIVAPAAIIEYFGTGSFIAKECDFAYNATQMAVQWDALATGDTRIMLSAQHVITRKPNGSSWITYTRCHDDIGLGFDDYMIEQAGFNSFHHRHYLKNYYSGNYPGSQSMGALFSSNPKTGDARISGSLASLCGLEKALELNNELSVSTAIQKILFMQAMSFFVGGLPMLFYGDEVGYTNDYSFMTDITKSYDNRWMHRPIIDWDKNNRIHSKGTIEEKIFSGTKKMLSLRAQLPALTDHSNLKWMSSHNIHVAGFVRENKEQKIFCIFNFSSIRTQLKWLAFKELGMERETLIDHYTKQIYQTGKHHENLEIDPFAFMILEQQ